MIPRMITAIDKTAINPDGMILYPFVKNLKLMKHKLKLILDELPMPTYLNPIYPPKTSAVNS